MQTFDVSAERAGERLDVFLARALALPRHQVQKLIKQGAVTVNHEAHPTVHRWLKTSDRVAIVASAPSPPERRPEATFTVVAETADYLVVHKPSGVIVHPAAGSVAPVLTSALLAQYPNLADVGDRGRPGIVHRLDRDVSGLLVVAKTQAMYNCLHDQFRTHQVMKRYTALVEGVVAAPDGVLDFPLARSRTHLGRIAARPRGAAGRAAVTRFEVLKRFRHHTLLALQLVTGRTHQIRAHLKAFGHPLVGDSLYAAKRKTGGMAAKPDIDRPFLQATEIGFFNLDRQWQEFRAPLDEELQQFLVKIA